MLIVHAGSVNLDAFAVRGFEIRSIEQPKLPNVMQKIFCKKHESNIRVNFCFGAFGFR